MADKLYDDDLQKALDQFKDEMQSRLFEKENVDGWIGWNDKELKSNFVGRLRAKANRLLKQNFTTDAQYQKDCIDTANFAMFLYDINVREARENGNN